MPDTTTASTFVLRRLAVPLPVDLSGAPAAQYALAAAVGVLGLGFTAWRFARLRRRAGLPAAAVVAALRAAGFALAALAVALPAVVVDRWGNVSWLFATGGALGVALSTVVSLYALDRRSAGWRAAPLALLRAGVFGLLAWAFLLPALQQWEDVRKASKVVVVLDVSPSVAQVSDDPSATAARPGKTRLDAVIDFLTDDTAGFVGKLLEKNPVTVYRFGGRLDDEAGTIESGAAEWTAAEWKQFALYDFKPWVLRNLSDDGRALVVATAAWKGNDPGTADWAVPWAKLPADESTPAGLAEADARAFADARAKLERRVDVARAVAAGTNVPESLAAVVSRESGNLVQGVIVFSDGRSTLASESGVRSLKERAAREKIPVFTVAVGEPREAVRIALTDVQAPDVVPPGEEFKVVAEADGVGLAGVSVPVTLDVYLPGRNPKTDRPDDTLDAVPLVFQGDASPPHGQAEFVIDPAKLKPALTDPVPAGVPGAGRRQLKQGAWQVVARAPRDKREAGGETEAHRSPPRRIEVLDRPTRVLLFAGGPTREYQTLRTLLVRETSLKRAELSIYLQSSGGRDGTAVQDVPPERLLSRFPAGYDPRNVPRKPEERFYNLNEYDLIVAFDPDWSELSADQILSLQTWVDNGGGGLVYVAGPLNTFQLARADADGRLKPLLDVLPVVPDDIILIKTRPTPRTPRRVTLKPSAEYDVLRLDDDPADDPTAGWEPFFTGAAKLTPGQSPQDLMNPKRGFFSYYPLKGTKPGASTLAEFQELSDRGDPDPKPWLVTAQASAGRTVFLAAGETWLFRAFDKDYFDRFWVKLTRYAAGGRKAAGTSRGRVLVAKEATSGSQVRVQVKLLGPNGRAYPADAAAPKFRVERFAQGEDKREDVQGPFELRARVSGAGFDGYYTGQVTADPAKFPAADKRYRVVVDVPDSPGDTLAGEFALKASDPELDNARPDFAALEELAGTVDEVKARVKDPAVLEALRGQERDPARAKLAFRLADRGRLALIPVCLEATSTTASNRGAVRDLWDNPADLSAVGVPLTLVAFDVGGTHVEIGWLLAVVVLLLGAEWLARKLLRLA